jgi:hypothetical protein
MTGGFGACQESSIVAMDSGKEGNNFRAQAIELLVCAPSSKFIFLIFKKSGFAKASS